MADLDKLVDELSKLTVIEAADLWPRTLAATDLGADEMEDAALRHHCYELQIGASHLGWYTWTDDDRERLRAASVLESILERGPRPLA